MAFDFGYFSVAAGEPFYFVYWFNGAQDTGGDDHGAQFCMAHTLEGYGATLYVTDQGKSNTGLHADRPGGSGWLYHMKGYNAGPYDTHCKLQGGGFV
jgi:hypothetical protein